MPQLERPVVAAGRHGRDEGGVEVGAVGGLHAGGDLVCREVVKQVSQNEAGAVLVGPGEQLLERGRPGGDVVTHEQAAVLGNTLENRLLAC